MQQFFAIGVLCRFARDFALRSVGCCVSGVFVALARSPCQKIAVKTPKSTVRGRWSRSRWFMHRRWESVTWGFTGNAGRKSPKLPRKPPFFAPRDLPYIVRLCVFAPNFRQDAPWEGAFGSLLGVLPWGARHARAVARGHDARAGMAGGCSGCSASRAIALGTASPGTRRVAWPRCRSCSCPQRSTPCISSAVCQLKSCRA